MFARSVLVRAATSTPSKDLTKQPSPPSTVPTVSPAVIRSLYRSLYREVSRLDRNPLMKVLFPCNRELQAVIGSSRPLHLPGGKNYTAVLREVFRDTSRVPKINLAFDTLNRLRAHYDNVKAKLPVIEKDRSRLLASMRSPVVAARRKDLFRASTVVASPEARPKYVQAAPGVPTRVVLRESYHNVDLQEGTLLLAHPLSSAYEDRRVLLITERTPVITTALVLDLRFIHPLSRGNPMFPEVFWGHEVYNGGFNQVGLTMPPTARIAVLHTLEPRSADGAEEDSHDDHGAAAATSGGGSGASSMMSWLKWKDSSSSANESTSRGAAAAGAPSAVAIKKHNLLCHPLILGGVQDDGTREPTLYISKVEALPYLGELALGQPRSSLRVYWGSVQWTTAELETEVANGHWMAVTASPSFFQPYSLADIDDHAAERFPTRAQLAEARQLREKRYGADITPLQVFPPDQMWIRREVLWDEIMFAMGGEYAALVGCSNPFSDHPRWPSEKIPAEHVAPLSLTADDETDAPVASSEDEETAELLASSPDTIPKHSTAAAAEEETADAHNGVPGKKDEQVLTSSNTEAKPSATQKQASGATSEASSKAQKSDEAQPMHPKDKEGE